MKSPWSREGSELLGWGFGLGSSNTEDTGAYLQSPAPPLPVTNHDAVIA